MQASQPQREGQERLRQGCRKGRHLQKATAAKLNKRTPRNWRWYLPASNSKRRVGIKEDIEVILNTPQPAIEYKDIRTTMTMTFLGSVELVTEQETLRSKKWLRSLKERLKKQG